MKTEIEMDNSKPREVGSMSVFSKRRIGWAVIRRGLLGVALLAVFLPAQAQEGGRQIGDRTAFFTDTGTEGCMRCHGGENMQVVGETPHGNLENPHTPYAQQGCESCHGPGSLHVSRARGGMGFPAMMVFDDRAPATDRNAACLDCHAETQGELEGMAWTGSVHDTDEITCGACHQLHTTENPLADRKKQADSCFDCHQETKKTHPRFESAGIVFDQLSCWDCHDVHQLEME